MTRAYYRITEGADIKLWTVQRTDGADTVQVPMQVEAEPEVATYALTATTVALSTANSHVLQVMAGASLRVGIRSIRVQQVANASSTARVAFQVVRLTTAGTGGGGVSPLAHDPAEAAAGCTAMTLPTAKGTEGSAMKTSRHLLHATSATVGLEPLLIDYSWHRTKALWIAAGISNGIAIKNVTSDAAATVDVEVVLVETSVA